MSEDEAESSDVETELNIAIDRISDLHGLFTDLERQVQSKTDEAAVLQSQVGQLEAVIHTQAQMQQKVEREMGRENIQWKNHVSHLVGNLDESTKRIQFLEAELARQRCISCASKMRFQKEPGAGQQAHCQDQTEDFGSIAHQLAAELYECKNELTRCRDRAMVHVKCIEDQRTAGARLLGNLTIAKEEERKLKNLLQKLQTELQVRIRNELDLTEEIQRQRLGQEKNASSSAKLIQGLDNSIMQKILADKQVLHEQLLKAQARNVDLLAKVESLESTIQQESEPITTRHAMSSSQRVLHKKLLKTQEENQVLLTQVKILESKILEESKTITTPRAMSAEMLQQLHKLYLQ